jgi:DNA mismatch repair protein MutS
LADVESRLAEFRHDFQNHVQEMIVDRLAILHPELFGSLLAYQRRYGDLVDPVIARFDQESQLYLAYLDLIQPLKKAGLHFCYPEVSAHSLELSVRDTFDLALARRLLGEQRQVVVNDIELRGAERIAVISGPNQGGKTTLARTFGQLHYLSALGLPVPGTSGRTFLSDRILTHFAKQEQVEDLHSGLEDELLRVREMLGRATSRSVVVMNESFASTTSDDQLFLGREIIGRLIEMNVLAVYVTFIDELSRLGPSVISMMSTVRSDNPAERTFKVVRKPADGHAYAMVLAEAHGLTYDAITAKVRS